MPSAFFCALAALLLAAGPTAARADCAAALRVTTGKVCSANAHGVVLAPDRSEADRLGALARGAESRFARYFGQPPARYAIVQDAAPGELKALNNMGVRRTLPWLTARQFEDLTLGSVRKGSEAQAKSKRLDAERTRMVVDKAVEAWRARNTPAVRHGQEEGIIPHEAGHGWYVERFWPGLRVDAKGHYGGPGPDWLDETAAVLLEGESFTQTRREMFVSIYRGELKTGTFADITRKELIDLPRFLLADHPLKGLQESLAGKPSSGIAGIRVMTGADAQKAARLGVLYYLQSRLFADYLIERSGKPAIFADIGAAFGRGQTIEQWLAARGGAHRLGSSVAAVDADWRRWLAARPAVAKPAVTS